MTHQDFAPTIVDYNTFLTIKRTLSVSRFDTAETRGWGPTPAIALSNLAYTYFIQIVYPL